METISICISCHNTLSRGNEVLERTVNSIVNSINYLKQKRDDVKVIISWTDDASTDNSLNEVKRLRNLQENSIKDNFFIYALPLNQGQAYGRNYAAKMNEADYICVFDSDDEMYENHLFVCYSLMQKVDPKGQKFALAMTSIDLSEDNIDPYWEKMMNNSIPINKIIRRDAWEFIEGMPTDWVFKKAGGEDMALFTALTQNFAFLISTIKTVKYYNYPNSSFDRQLEKFRNPPGTKLDPSKVTIDDLCSLRAFAIQNLVKYLKEKAKLPNSYTNIEHLAK